MLKSPTEGLSSLVQKALQGRLSRSTYSDEGKECLVKTESLPFTYLTLDIPQIPLYKSCNSEQQSAIPHVSLSQLLMKYDPQQSTFQEPCFVSYQIESLPEYLVLHFRRFVKNNFFLEKNPTIVLFPLQDLDLSSLLGHSAKYDLIANICHDG